MKNILKQVAVFGLLFSVKLFFSQNYEKYSLENGFSHNDYLQTSPLIESFTLGFGLIEVDVHWDGNNLMVAHDASEIQNDRTLETLYIKPLSKLWVEGKGRPLKLLIDLKTPWQDTLPQIQNLLETYPNLHQQVQFVITGNIPPKELFSQYPYYLMFDGRISERYSQNELAKIAIISDDFKKYTQWNGKGYPKAREKQTILETIDKVHSLGKPIRFWGSPDEINAWHTLMVYNVDYISTDQPKALAEVLERLAKSSYTSKVSHQPYQPKYKNFNKKKAKNILLFIPDGISLPQLYAAYTANGNNLNIFKMPYSGVVNTSSADSFITDSAPGSTAFSSGVKTNNAYVGVDKKGNPLELLPDILDKYGKVSAVVTTAEVTDATPADFYAHTTNRNDHTKIISFFPTSKLKYLAGSPFSGWSEEIENHLKNQGIKIAKSLDCDLSHSKKTLILDQTAEKMKLDKRNNWLQQAYSLFLNKLNKNKQGFFFLIEASQTDVGGHWRDLPYAVSELQEMDNIVGSALKFADENEETLVVVVGDHETGGLTLLGGNPKQNKIFGQFATMDHTALPTIVFAYGPGAEQFTGFMDNTDVFYKLLKAINMQHENNHH
ncbi:alkaline phosphatase [Riemerella anatipestifer]|uniref:Alkaline phosphatase n=1 Tax=Riemerella anatipestifer RA-CH-1 TaxID=1228997 RepID=J9QX87_RIEAN|nr:alkaline phosphatase [Riemerella anatipestifer]AFR34725.1 hypothetical protein B739_0117 [Riemerella anatipestifer RA-CH-1]MCO7331533.1 alkaline phosphatase [Riemerella anatipestifer]MCO7350421.1 alkaline phosphatase [Riemerella anatipestifer]MCU7582529.1 alkaline phosphatase [Riemerella anatipestifer]MCW0485793.1 alkaline phosphatase [Riemerella anatipestifer]